MWFEYSTWTVQSQFYESKSKEGWVCDTWKKNQDQTYNHGHNITPFTTSETKPDY